MISEIDCYLENKAIENKSKLNMELCINPLQLRKALKDIEEAEANGFNSCLSVFKITETGGMLADIKAEYVDVFERANFNNHLYDWGRDNYLSKKYKFKNGSLTLIKKD